MVGGRWWGRFGGVSNEGCLELVRSEALVCCWCERGIDIGEER